MPSEKIYDSNSMFDVEVAWGRDCAYVQVATVLDGEAGAERIVRYVNEWLTAAGQPPINFDSVRRLIEDKPSFTGWHAQLNDRRQVNDLIRVLKRARDAAFGRDE